MERRNLTQPLGQKKKYQTSLMKVSKEFCALKLLYNSNPLVLAISNPTSVRVKNFKTLIKFSEKLQIVLLYNSDWPFGPGLGNETFSVDSDVQMNDMVSLRSGDTLTRTLSGFEILNNANLIFQKWLVSRHFANIFHYLNFSEEYLWEFS